MIDPVQIEEWHQKLQKCGCGRVGRYETSTGLACNKYMRCDNAEFLAEQLKELQAQLESEKVSHAAWEQQHLLEYSEVVQERDAQAAMIQQMALEYISEQGQWIDDIAKYKALCDQMGAFLEFAWRDVPMSNYAFDRLETAIAAWREMKGGCDVPNSE